MANPEDETAADKTTINVKGVRKSSWEAARRGAAQRGDSMGAWLSDAIDRRISREARQIELPSEPARTPPLTPDQLTQRIMAVAALQQSAAALKMARVRSTGRDAMRIAQESLAHEMDADRGRPARTISGKARGKEWPVVRQSEMNGAAEP